jgi:hypothetical protein
MSGLFNKIKGSFDGISNKMKADSSAIAKVIKENKELVDAEDKPSFS